MDGRAARPRASRVGTNLPVHVVKSADLGFATLQLSVVEADTKEEDD
jgi:hypothetical protein